MAPMCTPRFVLLLLILWMGFVVGCSKRPNDEIIAKDIQNKVAADSETKPSQIEVVSKAGKVTLSGKAATAAAQQKAEQFARLEPGVVSVEDVTSVEPEPAPPEPTPLPSSAATPPEPTQTMAPPPVEEPKPRIVVLPAGTVLAVRVGTSLSSKASQSGESFPATLAQPVTVQGEEVIPAGARATGTVVAAKAKGKIKGQGQLDLALTSITVKGQAYTIQTKVLQSTVKGKGKRTAATTGGGAAGGALIGGIAGGGKGAAIGALVGAGAGLVGGTLTGNKQIEIPAEAALSFQLREPLTINHSAE